MSAIKRCWNCLKYDDHHITAWLKTAMARAPTTIIVALFSAAGLIFLAGTVSGCDTDDVDMGIITLQVSSILAATQVGENVINLFLAPFLGALADSSCNRKVLLIVASVLSVGTFGVSGLALLLPPSLALLWFYIIGLIVTSIFYELSVLLVFAYLPEICPDKELLTTIVSRQYAMVNGAQLGVAIVLGGASLVIDGAEIFDTPLPLTVIAHLVVVVWFMYFGVPGIYYLPTTETKVVADEDKVSTCTQLLRTFKEVNSKYPQVRWFLLSWTFFFSGIAAVTVLQVAYTADELGFETADIAVVGVLLLIFSVIGAGLCEVVAKYVRLKTILMTTLIVWTGATVLAPWVLRGQDVGVDEDAEVEVDANGCNITEGNLGREPTVIGGFMIYIMAIIFGLGIGFVYPTNVAIFSLIIPGGEEATYFGLKTFCSKILAWAPALAYTVINESTQNLQISFMSISIWFLLSIPFLWLLDVDKGIEDVKHTMHKRQGAGADLYGDKRLSVKEKMDEESKVLEKVNPVAVAAEAIEDVFHEEEGEKEEEEDIERIGAEIKEDKVEEEVEVKEFKEEDEKKEEKVEVSQEDIEKEEAKEIKEVKDMSL